MRSCSSTSTASSRSTRSPATAWATPCSLPSLAACARSVRPDDTVARHGGDEFIVLCENLTVEADAADVAERILDAFSRPLRGGRPALHDGPQHRRGRRRPDGDGCRLRHPARRHRHAARQGPRGSAGRGLRAGRGRSLGPTPRPRTGAAAGLEQRAGGCRLPAGRHLRRPSGEHGGPGPLGAPGTGLHLARRVHPRRRADRPDRRPRGPRAERGVCASSPSGGTARAGNA